MDSALLVIEEPEDNSNLHNSWLACKDKVSDLLSTTKKGENLGGNSWLIPLKDRQCNFLIQATHFAAAHQLRYRILFFPEPPDWLYSYAHS